MNPEIKEKWLKALRSGEYAQGKRVLRDENNKYCCLGVLCDVLGREWVKADWAPYYGIVEDSGGPFGDDPNNPYIHAMLPPDSVWKEAGMWDGVRNKYDQQVILLQGTDALSAMNDNGASFEEIADAIERSL